MHVARGRGRFATALLILLTLAPWAARAGTVTLKNGTVYRGTNVDTDETIVTIFDDLSRILVKDTKVAKIESDSEPKLEGFPLVQPLEVHGGAMPISAVNIKTTPWDSYGRRQFEFLGPKSTKPVRMTQAINGID